MDSTTYGFVVPIVLLINLDEVVSDLKILGTDNSNVVELKRLYSKDGPTYLVKITFDGRLPTKVLFLIQVFQVRQFSKDPLLCYRCCL